MDKKTEILQNQFHDINISLERADLIQCDHRWRGTGGRPPYSSIGLICDGTGTIIVDGQEMQPVKNQLYLLPAHTSQIFFNDGTQPYLKYFCHFNIKLHDTELFEYLNVPLCVTLEDPDTAIELFKNLISASKEENVLSFIKAKQYMLDLVCYYLQSCQESNIALATNAVDTAIDKAVAYADKNMHRLVSVAEMAEIAGYHPSHFTKLFRNRFGVSPAQFIIQKKTHYAMDQLMNTVKPVADISNSLGFSSQFYFCNFFKRQTGMTPTEYRQIYTKNIF
jgi:AraC-like DNA-binding protein